MKKKKLIGLKLNRVKIADFNSMRTIFGGSGAGCDMYESRRICEGGDTGGGGNGGTILGCQQTGPTQHTCGCPSQTSTIVDC